MTFKVGDRVKFVGRPSEIGFYHPSFQELMGEIGTVIEKNSQFIDVLFDNFKSGVSSDYCSDTFLCFDTELVVVG